MSHISAIRNALPRGRTLPHEAWERRHTWMLRILWLHVVALPLYGLAQGYSLLHSAGHMAGLLVLAVLGMAPLQPRIRSVMVAGGLLTASALAVHESHGVTEAHFHFFVVIVILALYEDWVPFLLSLAYVVIHHGVMGVLAPHDVYDHADAWAHPWKWAAIHGGFVLAAASASVVSWRLNEDVREEALGAERAARRSEERFRRSFDDAPIGMALTSADGHWVRVNHSLCAMTGYSQDELTGLSFAAITHPDDRVHGPADTARLLSGEIELIEREKRYIHADGHHIWVALRISRLQDDESASLIAQIEDITARKRADEQARRRADQHALLADLGAMALGGLELDRLFPTVVDGAAAGLGVSHVRLLQIAPGGEVMRQVAQRGWTASPETPVPATGQHAFTLVAGSPVVVADVAGETRFDTSELRAAGLACGMSVVVADRGGEPFGVLGVHHDEPREFSGDDVHFAVGLAVLLGGALQRQRSEHELRHQSLHDPLTGLPNRKLFLDRLERAVLRTRRTGEAVAVLFLDLDQFKVINDSLGHEAGDLLLKNLAPRLGQCLRGNDTLSRFGGDEFVVLCESLSGAEDAVLVAERMRALFDDPIQVGDQTHFVTASIGLAISNDSYAGRPEALVRDADAAMYRAKDGGRDRFEVFDEVMRERAVSRLETEGALRRALENDELHLVYQPLVSLADGTIAHCEALVRWEHPERGLVAPGEFIPVAEESGLILPLGAWVLNEACRQAAEWADIGVSIAVNLSAVQVGQPSLPDLVAETLERHGVAPERLIAEITETALIADPDRAARTLEALHALGVTIALDDFGTGYSSLSSLKRFPLHTIKLDRSFIHDLRPGTRDAAIVTSLVAMAESLGLVTVGEGVETEEQREQLAALGCRLAQGYLFARPLSAPEFERAYTSVRASPITP
jgi:diguanylate cyclase (GGDEF)-like protein/PAS domain S-box-containing protein